MDEEKADLTSLMKMFPSKIEKCSLTYQKQIIFSRFFTKHSFLLKYSPVHAECSFDNPAQNFLLKIRRLKPLIGTTGTTEEGQGQKIKCQPDKNLKHEKNHEI